MSATLQRWRDVSARKGRNDLPYYALMGIIDETLDRQDWSAAVANAWTGAEWPSRATSGHLDLWESIFTRAIGDDGGFITDDGVIKAMSELPETLMLYRGADEERREGLSWTREIAIAQWFATRLNRGGKVYEITIPRELVLAEFHIRSESEIVIAVSQLLEDDIKEIG